MAANVLCLFIVVVWVGLQCAIVAFPGRIHLSFGRDHIPIATSRVVNLGTTTKLC